MARIKKILENELVGGTQTTDIYPITSIKAIYDENNERLDNIIKRRSIVNVSTNYNDAHIAEVLTLYTAIDKVPYNDRELGFIMTFLSSEGWNTYQFKGESISESEWGDINKWSSVQNDSLADANKAMQGIGRYTYGPSTKTPSIYIEGSHRVLNWESLEIIDWASHQWYIEYFKGLNMILPLSGKLVIYGEIVETGWPNYEKHLSVFYASTPGITYPGESHTEFYKKINNTKDIVILGVVGETTEGIPVFHDSLRIASFWKGVPSLTNDVDTLINDVNTLKSQIEQLNKQIEKQNDIINSLR